MSKDDITVTEAIKIVHHFFKNRIYMIDGGLTTDHIDTVNDILQEEFAKLDKQLTNKFNKYRKGTLNWETEDENVWDQYEKYNSTYVTWLDKYGD